MLKLQNITKIYKSGDSDVLALSGVSLEFRRSEFVSVLGPSGCGKTTLLNIVGGLDKYTSGGLDVNGRSTSDFSDCDWDNYRNHRVGFVFQSYNLIPHQTVLSNVELALTLAGISKAERRRRARQALERVGLSSQIKKKPNQLSGGQMQRVAIARAIVNDPEILLADEPTGALDSETSLQIMELLREIAHDRLVIMVTHNPELAGRYSTRIVRLFDGKLQSDSAPYSSEEEKAPEDAAAQRVGRREKKASMSFKTALSLSFNNLLTKKGRTALTSFAGSIGIIGIALILSISNGMNAYIGQIEEDTLSTYPLTIVSQTIDMTAVLEAFLGDGGSSYMHDDDRVYANRMMTDMIKTMTSQVQNNDLRAFREYLESDKTNIKEITNDIKYGYSITPQIYSSDTTNGILQVNPSKLLTEMMGAGQYGGMMGGSSVFEQMLGNNELLRAQYDLLAGEWPDEYNEIVVVVNEFNEISDMALYALGLMSQSEVEQLMQDALSGRPSSVDTDSERSFSYEEILNTTFTLVTKTDYYEKNGDGGWTDKREDTLYMLNLLQNSEELKVSAILRPSPEAVATSISGVIGYTQELTEHIINKTNNSEIVKQQLENKDVNVFTGASFGKLPEITMDEIEAYIQTLTEEEQASIRAFMSAMSEEQILAMFSDQMGGFSDDATYEDNLYELAVCDLDSPTSINLYPKDFEAKEKITELISRYNNSVIANGHEELVISYTDTIGLLLSSVTTIVDAVGYVLIAFVSISLVVSSIMIGVITYISVLERTKEIGILRSIGASKRDISRVFNAETLIVGLTAGLIGIGLTLLLNIPINMIIGSLTDVSGIASLPTAGAVSLVLISVLLTVVAGLIPSRLAAKKDPVVALRSE